MELEAQRFYSKAAEQAADVGVRKLLGDLAEMKKAMRVWPSSLAIQFSRRTSGRKRTRLGAGCLFCSTYSPVSPA